MCVCVCVFVQRTEKKSWSWVAVVNKAFLQKAPEWLLWGWGGFQEDRLDRQKEQEETIFSLQRKGRSERETNSVQAPNATNLLTFS